MGIDVSVLTLPHLARHHVSELNRGGAGVFAEAANEGVIFNAANGRPDLIMAPLADWERLIGLLQATRITAILLQYFASETDQHGISLELPWLAALSEADKREFLRDLSEATMMSVSVGDPRAVFDALKGWKATAEYVMAGEPLAGPINWDEVVPLERPAESAD